MSMDSTAMPGQRGRPKLLMTRSGRGWLGADLADVGVWSLGYEAASLAWKGSAMPLIDRATNILDLLTSHGIGARPIVFIAHSLGALLAKQLLRQARDYNNIAWKPLADNTTSDCVLCDGLSQILSAA